MELYLCRHGETEWTLSGRHTGLTDIPLTPKGEAQSLLLGKRLKSIHFDAVYSSPLLRAKETCRLAGFTPILDPDLCEWHYGDYEGKTHTEIQDQNPGWNLFEQGAPQGESPEEIGKRVDRFLKKLPQTNQKIAIFSHGHLSRVIAARWLHLNPSGARYFFLSVASLSILGFERVQPVIRLWNDTHHLIS